MSFRRKVLLKLLAGLSGLVAGGSKVWGAPTAGESEEPTRRPRNPDPSDLGRTIRDADSSEKLQRALEEEAREVDQLYSTKPIRFRMGGRDYVIPVNYITPKGRDEPSGGDSQGFGFFLFLPDYGGYTKENWRDQLDPRLVKVTQVHPVNKNAMVPLTDGRLERIRPESYGEPNAAFRNLKPLFEDEPSFGLYGLKGYVRKGKGKTAGVLWTGLRSNGGFFFFRSTLSPGERRAGVGYPICQVRYYSDKEELAIAYRYPQQHIARWREIDDAIWARLHEWQVK